MNTTSMNSSQQSASLQKDQVVRLAPAGHRRWLQVLEGQVWVTVTAREGEASEDQTLAAGDSVELGVYDDVVVEGLSAARFQLVEPALALSPRAAWHGVRSADAALHAWVQRLSLTAVPTLRV